MPVRLHREMCIRDRNEPRAGKLVAGSYHVNADGTDITGVSFPVKVLTPWAVSYTHLDVYKRQGKTFRRKKLYRVMIRYVAPVMMLVLFLQSTGILA